MGTLGSVAALSIVLLVLALTAGRIGYDIGRQSRDVDIATARDQRWELQLERDGLARRLAKLRKVMDLPEDEA